MATITNATLGLTHDHQKKTVRAVVRCSVNFTALEQCQMKTPSATESRTFDVLLGEGVLDEDWGEDEVYGLLKLVNLSSLVEVRKKTNTVSHSF